MKKYKKTYAIFHLTEKHTVFFLGKTKVHVSFTGGIVTKKGVTPATFTTSDPIIQLAIEQSADFKNGVIKIKSKYATQEELKIGMNIHSTSNLTPEETQPYQGTANIINTKGLDSPTIIPTDKKSSAPAEQVTESEQSSEKETPVVCISEACSNKKEDNPQAEEKPIPENELEPVEATCKDVAKQYLQEHYGENPVKLRTRADIQEAAARHGIIFIFP